MSVGSEACSFRRKSETRKDIFSQLDYQNDKNWMNAYTVSVVEHFADELVNLQRTVSINQIVFI